MWGLNPRARFNERSTALSAELGEASPHLLECARPAQVGREAFAALQCGALRPGARAVALRGDAHIARRRTSPAAERNADWISPDLSVSQSLALGLRSAVSHVAST